MRLGAHMSISGGLHKAFARGEQVGIEAMQIFSKSERQWRAKPLQAQDIELYRAEEARSGIGPVVVHDSYLINLASPNDELWEKSIAAFSEELERCAALNIRYLVTHPGAHTGSGEAAGLQREAEALNRILGAGIGGTTYVLLETTAGQGTTLGYRFEHLAQLYELVHFPERLGVCFDTCHVLAAGYDIRDQAGYTATMAEFERFIGLQQIRCFHLNDSQGALGSRLDRHTHIGQGAVGLEGFRLLLNDPRFQDRPMIIETPRSDDMAEDIENLRVLRSLRVDRGEG